MRGREEGKQMSKIYSTVGKCYREKWSLEGGTGVRKWGDIIPKEGRMLGKGSWEGCFWAEAWRRRGGELRTYLGGAFQTGNHRREDAELDVCLACHRICWKAVWLEQWVMWAAVWRWKVLGAWVPLYGIWPSFKIGWEDIRRFWAELLFDLTNLV